MEIHLGSDHRGFALKQQVYDYLTRLEYSCVDHGTADEERTDYPEYAKAVGEAVAGRGPGSCGMLFCGSGAGIAIPANKVRGVRCVVAWCEHVSEYGRRHNHANVLAFGADLQTFTEVKRCVDAYLAAAPEGDRHAERVKMVNALDEAREQPRYS
jgi:ribose 5-phosphate isomerase B